MSEQALQAISECNKLAKPSDLLQILDALVDPVSDYLGCATGIEDDRSAMLMQLQKDEQE